MALAAPVLVVAPARADPPLPTVDVAAATAQCALAFRLPGKSDGDRAGKLMAGRAELGNYGWFPLAKNVSWRPYSTLDSSGKGHMHSLDWLLPLLREGVRTGNSAVVNRFYAVLKDWVADNGPGASSARYAWGPPIYEGFRAVSLTCAAAGPNGRQPWLIKALELHGR